MVHLKTNLKLPVVVQLIHKLCHNYIIGLPCLECIVNQYGNVLLVHELGLSLFKENNASVYSAIKLQIKAMAINVFSG